jgi:hypothetical protein
VAGKIIADTIEASGSQISLNVGNLTILTASSTGLTLIPTTNVNINLTNSIVNLTSGNVTNPSLTFSGNTSTGIFMPAANTIAFGTAGSEDMRITATGILDIGGSSGGSVGELLVVEGANSAGHRAARINNTGTTNGYSTLWMGSSNDGLIRGGSTAGTLTDQLLLLTSGATPVSFYTNNTERMRIDGSGNVGIGLTSPGNRLYVSKSDNTYYLTDFANSIASGNGYVNRMMFTGSAPNSTGSIFSAMVDTSANRCVIYANGGIHNYQANNANLSDRREKTNFAPAKSYLDIICNIPVQTFNYIDQNLEEDDGLTLGVVAQDIQEVAPELVMESNWGTEEEPKMRLSVYQTDLQYALMKSIQELKAIVDAQAVEIAALKAK